VIGRVEIYQHYRCMSEMKEMKLNNLDVKVQIGNANINENEKINFEIKILFYDISHFRPISQLVICSIGVFIFYLMYGYMQVIICRTLSNALLLG
jgi:hypothetical protein